MKTTVHDSCKYPWGSKTLVTVDDEGCIYNFSIPSDKLKSEDIVKIAEGRVINFKESQQAELQEIEEIETLQSQKEVLIDEIAVLQAQKDALANEIGGSE
jgi:hypothetical protein